LFSIDIFAEKFAIQEKMSGWQHLSKEGEAGVGGKRRAECGQPCTVAVFVLLEGHAMKRRLLPLVSVFCLGARGGTTPSAANFTAFPSL